MLSAGVSGLSSDGDKEFAAGRALNNLVLGSTQPAVNTPSATTGTAAMSKDEGTATAITMAMAVSATNQINRWTRRRLIRLADSCWNSTSALSHFSHSVASGLSGSGIKNYLCCKVPQTPW